MYKSKRFAIPLLLGGLILVVVISATGIKLFLTTSSNQSSISETSTSSSSQSSEYKDGTYTAIGTYSSPEGRESVGVSITIANNKISAVAITPKATNRTSLGYQNLFKTGITGKVVGKSVDSITSIGRINGASLTGSGFLNALIQIKNNARV